MRRFRGTVWRHVPPGAEPLHLGWILKAGRGRWNTVRPRLPCLYTALRPEGAIAEFEKHVEAFAGRRRRRDLVDLAVDVDDVLDLTSVRIRRRLGIPPGVLTSDDPSHLAYCRRLALRHVRGGGYGAILAPSAALAGEVNLMIYNLRTEHIREIGNGPHRIPFGPGFVWRRRRR